MISPPPNSEIIPGFNGFYRADKKGRIWSCYARGRIKNRKGKWRVMRTFLDQDGYCFICLWIGETYVSKKVHRLVLEAFVGPCPEGRLGRHHDSNPKNNRLDNLSWSTQKENMSDRTRNGTDTAGEKNASAKLTWKKVRQIRWLGEEGGLTQLGRQFRVSPSTIKDILKRRSWQGDHSIVEQYAVRHSSGFGL